MNTANERPAGSIPHGWTGRSASRFRARAVSLVVMVCALTATAEAQDLVADPGQGEVVQQVQAVQAHADFGRETASGDARAMADWVVQSGDNQALPFVIVDKIGAKVFVFYARGAIIGAAPALLGLGRGDDTVPGIGQRRLATITPAERTTPAGRFVASLGHDFEQDILWIDYDASLSLHRVIVGTPADKRHARLASPSVLDNRISYGCINVPVAFYDTIVAPAFEGTVGIVYILPETRPIDAVFAMRKNLGEPMVTLAPAAIR